MGGSVSALERRACLIALIATGSCADADSRAPATEAEPNRPSGTVLVMNDVPIQADEVDRIASAFAVVEPQDTPTQLRRLALSNSVFPRIAAAGIDPSRRSAAEALAHRCREFLAAGADPPGVPEGPQEVEREGYFKELGFEQWRVAIDLAPDTWSPVFETPGSFHILRVKSRKEGALPTLTRLRIGAFDFSYLDAATVRAEIEAALDRSRLTILDDNWRDAVPAAWRYRLHVESP